MFLLLPAVHAEEGLAEPHDQAARSPQASCCKCQTGLGPGALMQHEQSEAAVAVPRMGRKPCGLCHWGIVGACGDPRQPHAVLTWPWALCLSPLPHSVLPVPSASCPGQSCSCMRLSSTVGRSCLCVRSVGTGPRAATDCRCTSRPSIGVCQPVLARGLALLPAAELGRWHLLTFTRVSVLPPESSACSFTGVLGTCGTSKGSLGAEAGKGASDYDEALYLWGQVLSFL